MKLVTLPDKILRTHHHTLLVMQDGRTRQAVCVMNDRLIGAVDSKLLLIEEIASRKLMEGEVAFDGRVWITPADLPRPVHGNLH